MWIGSFGVRYANRISPRPEDPAVVERLSGRIEDSMSNERWDVEVDVVFEKNSNIDNLEVTIPPGSSFIDGVSGAMTPIPTSVVIPHNWQDQLSVRLGGDYNLIPGMAALRAGVSFETRGVDPTLVNLDFLPAQRFGVHTGLTVRLGRTDINLAYAHIFQETIEVAPGNAALRQTAAVDPAMMASIINAGTYTANFDAFAVGVNYHFR
jgi:long-subunit fatty acid transport protein